MLRQRYTSFVASICVPPLALRTLHQQLDVLQEQSRTLHGPPDVFNEVDLDCIPALSTEPPNRKDLLTRRGTRIVGLMGFASSHATEDYRARDLVSKHPRDLVERDNHAAANLQRLRKQQHAGHVAEDQSSKIEQSRSRSRHSRALYSINESA